MPPWPRMSTALSPHRPRRHHQLVGAASGYPPAGRSGHHRPRGGGVHPGAADGHLHVSSWSKKLLDEGESFGFYADVSDLALLSRSCHRRPLLAPETALALVVSNANAFLAGNTWQKPEFSSTVLSTRSSTRPPPIPESRIPSPTWPAATAVHPSNRIRRISSTGSSSKCCAPAGHPDPHQRPVLLGQRRTAGTSEHLDGLVLLQPFRRNRRLQRYPARRR